MRSDAVKKGDSRAAQRSLLRACGLSESDMRKPFIAIVGSHVDIIPGHVHLKEVNELVKDAVRAAGGVPFVFNTIGICDGVAMGHDGMKYSLASREIIADAVESMAALFRAPGGKTSPALLAAGARRTAMLCPAPPSSGWLETWLSNFPWRGCYDDRTLVMAYEGAGR